MVKAVVPANPTNEGKSGGGIIAPSAQVMSGRDMAAAAVPGATMGIRNVMGNPFAQVSGLARHRRIPILPGEPILFRTNPIHQADEINLVKPNSRKDTCLETSCCIGIGSCNLGECGNNQYVSILDLVVPLSRSVRTHVFLTPSNLWLRYLQVSSRSSLTALVLAGTVDAYLAGLLAPSTSSASVCAAP